MAICADLELGVPEKYAAEANGVDESTFHEWIKKGDQGRAPYAAFCRTVSRSRARMVINLLARALAGGPGSRQAMWLLQRRRPDDFSLRGSSRRSTAAPPSDSDLATASNRPLAPAALKQLYKAIAIAKASQPNRDSTDV
jgi:hypothetical protein